MLRSPAVRVLVAEAKPKWRRRSRCDLSRVPADSNIWWWERHWKEALKTVDPALKAELIAVRERMHFALFKQLLLGSPFLVLTIVPLVLATLIQHAGRKLLWNMVRTVYKPCEEFFERRVSRPLDALAYRVGTVA